MQKLILMTMSNIILKLLVNIINKLIENILNWRRDFENILSKWIYLLLTM